MSNTRRENHASGDVQSVSPAKPIMGASVNGLQTFFYKKTTDKHEGFSPNGKQIIPLSKYEGAHHLKGRGESGEIMTGDSPIKTQRRHDLAYHEDKLLLALMNLKERTDQDYKFYVTYGEINEEHYFASRIKIRQCVALLKTCYALYHDKDVFFNKLNDQVEAFGLYNPFFLHDFYKAESFDAVCYETACQEIKYQCGFTKENFTSEESAIMKKSRGTDSSFTPRNVRMRREEAEADDRENKKSVVRKIMF